MSQERVATEYGAKTTAKEVIEGIDLSGKSAIVTGGGSGIGIETARALAGAGAAVTLAVRDVDAAESVARDIRKTESTDDVAVAALDLTDLDSIGAFASEWQGPLEILVNNAGVMHTPQERTRYGWELQFATNHMGHFALTTGLKDALVAAKGARVVSVSSSAHKSSPVVFDDIMFETREYDPSKSYGQAKTANVLFAVELTNRWSSDRVFANALMPGGIWTRLQRHWSDERKASLKERADRGDAPVTMKTPEQGASTSVLLAASPALEGIGGRYFEDCQEAEMVGAEDDVFGGVREYALDPESARRLWEVSEELLAEARASA
jgi:NAD(P)-dependent dehydrogenase (short-subunit alcohol dehydrogenase family)